VERSDETARTLPRVLIDRANEDGGRPFVIEVDGRSDSYADAVDAMYLCAGALRAFGIAPADRVIVMLPNCLEALHAWIGIAWLGAIEVPVNTGYRARSLEHVVRNAKPTLAIVHSDYAVNWCESAVLKEMEIPIVVVGDLGAFAGWTAHTVSFEGFLNEAQPWTDGQPKSWDIASILYTSGTTGPSKGVLMPWAQLHVACEVAMPLSLLGPSDAWYSPFPMFHVSGKGPIYNAALAGIRVIIRPKFSVGEFWSDVDTFGITTTLLEGDTAAWVAGLPPSERDSAHPLGTVMMGPVIPAWEAFRDRFDVKILTNFNMTETSCPIVSDPFDLPNGKTCGRVRSGCECRIVDEHDFEVPVGAVGELIIRTDEPWVMMAGYFENPEATAAAWRNGWFHTGDACYRDTGGNFYWVDRMRHVVRRRGETISSYEVEVVLNEHESIRESAVVGVKMPGTSDEEIKAIVVPQEGADLDYTDIRRFVEERLPSFMVPRFFETMPNLPRTPTEKITKSELRMISPATWDATTEGRARV